MLRLGEPSLLERQPFVRDGFKGITSRRLFGVTLQTWIDAVRDLIDGVLDGLATLVPTNRSEDQG